LGGEHNAILTQNPQESKPDSTGYVTIRGTDLPTDSDVEPHFFFHVGLDLLKEGGTLEFITTNYYLTADGAEKLRADMYDRSEIVKPINFSE
jgi:hypothetical protein